MLALGTLGFSPPPIHPSIENPKRLRVGGSVWAQGHLSFSDLRPAPQAFWSSLRCSGAW